jgi:hypothetical protein
MMSVFGNGPIGRSGLLLVSMAISLVPGGTRAGFMPMLHGLLALSYRRAETGSVSFNTHFRRALTLRA